MTSLMLLICTVGIYSATPLAPEHCRYYDLRVYVPAPAVETKVAEFCVLARQLAVKHGGRLTRCEAVLPPEDTDDRRPGHIRA